MSVLQKHKIRTVSLQVNFEGKKEDVAVQDSLGLYFHEKIQPALEKTFDQYGDPKTTLVFNRLELDCGTLPHENWEAVFVQRIMQQLGEEINSSKKHNRSSITKEKKASEVFFFFLQRGYFPWNSPFSTPKELEKEIVFGAAVMNDLDFELQKPSVLIERIFKSFNKDFISKIFTALSQKSTSKINALVKYLQVSSELTVQKELMQVLLFFLHQRSSPSIGFFLETLISNFSEKSLPYLAKYLNQEMGRDKELEVEVKVLLSKATSHEFRRKLLLVRENIIKADPGFLGQTKMSLNEIDIKKANSIRKDIGEKSEMPVNFLANKEVQENTSAPISQWSQHEQIDLEPEDEIFIKNAGLVLLHPFLSELFSNLQLIENRKFVRINDGFVAAKALQFLVFGDNDHAENFFPLDKILCGISVAEVLDLDLELDHDSKAECEELLKVVIGHWSVLKNTSIEGLRETFLQREGKISRVDKGWKLQVERKAVDVLLAKLPWGVALIKLPWMDEMLFVEWD